MNLKKYNLNGPQKCQNWKKKQFFKSFSKGKWISWRFLVSFIIIYSPFSMLHGLDRSKFNCGSPCILIVHKLLIQPVILKIPIHDLPPRPEGPPRRATPATTASGSCTFLNQSSSFLDTWPHQRSRLQDMRIVIGVTPNKALSSALKELLLSEAPHIEQIMDISVLSTTNHHHLSLTHGHTSEAGYRTCGQWLGSHPAKLSVRHWRSCCSVRRLTSSGSWTTGSRNMIKTWEKDR